MSSLADESRVDFGIDAPEGLRNVTVGGVALFAGGLAVLLLTSWDIAAYVLFGAAAITGVFAVLWLAGTKAGKGILWNRLLDSLALRGDERVLDAGCGRGLLLLGAAKRLNIGQAIGIDLWAKDQSGNRPSATLANAALAGVIGRVSVTSGSVQYLPFTAGSFDLVVSNLVLDNLHDEPRWTEAVRELSRVLVPGGRLLLADLAHTEQYEVTLRDEGWTDVQRSGPQFLIFPPVRVISGTKPRGPSKTP